MNIVQIAKANVGNGIELVANGVNHDASAETHLLSKHSDGTYSIIESQRLVGQPSTAGVQ